MKNKFSRRDFLKVGGLAFLGTAGATALTQKNPEAHNDSPLSPALQHDGHDGLPGVGEVDIEKNGFNPSETLYDFDYGKVSTLANGQTLREY